MTDAPTHDFDFPPSAFTALRRALAVRPDAYAARRNHLDGAVTGLSPYITHGYLDAAALFEHWQQRFDLPVHKGLLSQLAWRSFFQHVWFHLGERIFEDQRPALAGVRYSPRLPDDILTASTGVPVIDTSIRTLYRTGYLHNHQRMWLASYIVHLRKVAWRTGADWMYGHLLDGDLASNHLSWQWVAGTFSSKPYLFNADNVARFAPKLASPGTVIDTTYEALGELATCDADVGPEPSRPAPVTMPPLSGVPSDLAIHTPLSASDAPVCLVHPWSLGRTPGEGEPIALLCPDFHNRFPWSARRWAFVHHRMAQRCDRWWVGNRLPPELARRAHTVDTLNPVYREALAAVPEGQREAVPTALPTLDAPTRSYSQYTKQLRKLGWM